MAPAAAGAAHAHVAPAIGDDGMQPTTSMPGIARSSGEGFRRQQHQQLPPPVLQHATGVLHSCVGKALESPPAAVTHSVAPVAPGLQYHACYDDEELPATPEEELDEDAPMTNTAIEYGYL